MNTIWLLLIIVIAGMLGGLVGEMIKTTRVRRPEEELVKPLQFSKYDLSALRTELPAWNIQFGNWNQLDPPGVTDGDHNAITAFLKGTQMLHGKPGKGPVAYTFWRSRYETVEEAFEQAVGALNDAQREFGHLRVTTP